MIHLVVHRIILWSPISVVINDTSDDLIRLNIHCDSLMVNTLNDSTRCCKGNRTCVELGRLTSVYIIVTIGRAFSLIV